MDVDQLIHLSREIWGHSLEGQKTSPNWGWMLPPEVHRLKRKMLGSKGVGFSTLVNIEGDPVGRGGCWVVSGYTVKERGK